MKTIKHILFFALATALIFGTYSCKRDVKTIASISGFTGDALDHIPNDAYAVGRIDIQGLMDKADFENVKNMEFYQNMIKEAEQEQALIAEILEAPSRSGIDLNEYMYFFSTAEKKSRQQPFNGLVFKLDDADEFAAMIKAGNQVNIKAKEGYRFATNGKDMAIGWTDDLAVVGSGKARDMEDEIIKVFNTERENSIVVNKGLKKVFGQQHDICIWAGSDAFAQTFYKNAKRQMSFMGIKEKDLKDNHFNTYIDFEDGFMVADMEYLLSKTLDEEFDMLVSKEVSRDFTPYIPAGDMSTATSIALNYDGIYKKIKQSGMMAFVNIALREYDLTVEDLAKTLDSDLAFVSYDNGQDAASSGLFISTIKDKSRLNKFMEIGEQTGMLTKIGRNEYAIKGAEDMMNQMMNPSQRRGVQRSAPSLLIRDDMLFITDRQDILTQVKSGRYAKSDRVKGKAADVLTGHTMGMYFDANNAKGIMQDLDEKYIEDMLFTINTKTSKIRINTLNKNDNSLKTFMEMLNEQYKKDGENIDISN